MLNYTIKTTYKSKKTLGFTVYILVQSAHIVLNVRRWPTYSAITSSCFFWYTRRRRRPGWALRCYGQIFAPRTVVLTKTI